MKTQLFKIGISGCISTNSNKELLSTWKESLDLRLRSTPLLFFQGRKISVKLIFWINDSRLGNRRNDIDNLTKPVLDSLTRSGIIIDDSDIFHLEATKFPTSGEEEVQIMVRGWNC